MDTSPLDVRGTQFTEAKEAMQKQISIAFGLPSLVWGPEGVHYERTEIETQVRRILADLFTRRRGT